MGHFHSFLTSQFNWDGQNKIYYFFTCTKFFTTAETIKTQIDTKKL